MTKNSVTWKWLAVGILLPVVGFGGGLALSEKIKEDRKQNREIEQLKIDAAFNQAVIKSIVDKLAEIAPAVERTDKRTESLLVVISERLR